MIQKRLRKFLPHRDSITGNKALKIFGTLLHNPNLWHLNRHSAGRAFAVGLFFAWIPVPFQMVLAAGAAIIIHGNLPLSIALVWITNPITMPALFFFAYKIGAIILGVNKPFNFSLSIDWLTDTVHDIWQPLLLGSTICAVVSSVVGYFGIKAIWRYFIIKAWRKRQENRKNRS